MAGCWLVGSAMRAGAQAPAVASEWAGTYTCAQGVTALDLSLAMTGGTGVEAVFHFGSAPPHREVPEGCFRMQGTFERATGVVTLSPTAWLLQPPGYVMVGLRGRITPDGGTLAGQVTGGFLCGAFTLRHVAAAPPRVAACSQVPPVIALAAH